MDTQNAAIDANMEPYSEQEEITKRNNPKPAKTDVNDALIKEIYDALFEQNKTNTNLLYRLRSHRAQAQIEMKFSTDKKEVPETGNNSTVSIELLQNLFTHLQEVNANLKAETLGEEPQRDSGFVSARSSAASLGRNSQFENQRNSEHVDGRNSQQEDGVFRQKETVGLPRPVSEAMIRQGSREIRIKRSKTLDNNDHPIEAIAQVGEISASGGATMDEVSKPSDIPATQPLESDNTGPKSKNLDCPTQKNDKTALPETSLDNAGTSTGAEAGRSFSSNSEPVENLDQSPSDSEEEPEDSE